MQGAAHTPPSDAGLAVQHIYMRARAEKVVT